MTAAVRPLVEIRDLTVEFRGSSGMPAPFGTPGPRTVRALDGVSLALDRGELVALVGESGSGKTTLAHTILRSVRPTAGRVLFDGTDVASMRGQELRHLRRRAQMTYQDPYESLDPRFVVARTIEEPLLIHGVGRSRSERANQVTAALERVGLTPPESFAARFPHELSGGQRQRVALAAALVLRPELLVADEPVSMLDASVRASLLAVLAGLRDEGVTILMITHDLATAARYADRICVMYLGRIVEDGPARRVVEQPRHPYTRALVSVVAPPDPRQATMGQVLRGEIPDAASIPAGCRFHPRCPIVIDACRVEDPALHLVDEQNVACLRA